MFYIQFRTKINHTDGHDNFPTFVLYFVVVIVNSDDYYRY